MTDNSQQNNSEQNNEQQAPEKSELDLLKEKISELENQNSNLNDKLLRTLAELENTRRRSREELEKSSKFAVTNFASDLVVVAENFFLASENSPKDEIAKSPAIKSYHDAIVMTEKELMKVLEKNNVARVFPLGEKFDHNLHEAISQIESEKEEGVVLQVIQSGYAIAGRLIRPALVVVAKAKA